MSNRRKVVEPDGTVRKVYIPRAERRRKRAERRERMGAPSETPVHVKPWNKDKTVGKRKATTNLVEVEVAPGQVEVQPPEGKTNIDFLIQGTKYVYDGLGGAEGFLRWARQHQVKFRELSFKLIPSQVAWVEKNMQQTVEIVHALPPPNYNSGAVRTVDVEKVREALMALSPEQRRLLLDETNEKPDPSE